MNRQIGQPLLLSMLIVTKSNVMFRNVAETQFPPCPNNSIPLPTFRRENCRRWLLPFHHSATQVGRSVTTLIFSSNT